MARIVLIEDNKDLRELLADSLTARGHEVWSTRDASAGVTRCERSATDLVITDLVVPNSEALEKLVSLRRTNAGLQVVVISGALDSPDAATRAERLAGAHVLAKPFRTIELVRLVEEVHTNSVAHS
jgi:DNA-binding response OmpR family regulator